MTKIGRRSFLAVASGAGIAAAGAVHRLTSNVTEPEGLDPGLWSIYVTTCRECPAGCGLYMSFRDGRVTKAEGNPGHPVSDGGLCPRGQSSVQGLYDPDRQRVPRVRRAGSLKPAEWKAAGAAAAAGLAALKGRLLILSGLETGTLDQVFSETAAAFGGRVLYYEPFAYEPIRQAHETLFGLPAIPRYDLSAVDFILSLGADFLETWISPVEFTRGFTAMHQLKDGAMGRMVYAGPRLSLTAANADRFIPLRPGDERFLGLHVLRELLAGGGARPGLEALAPRFAALPPLDRLSVRRETVTEIANAFRAGRAVTLGGAVGATGPAAEETARVAGLLNYAAGTVDGAGAAVDFSQPHALGKAAGRAEAAKALAELGRDDALMVVNANPAYSLPGADEALGRIGHVIYIGTMQDETAERATVFLPAAHYLESFSDYEPWAGLRETLQPTMRAAAELPEPDDDGKYWPGLHELNKPPKPRPADLPEAGDLVLRLARDAGKKVFCAGEDCARVRDVMEQNWTALHARLGDGDIQSFWTEALQRGGVWEKGAPQEVGLRPEALALPFSDRAGGDRIELWPFATVMLHDGRVSNRGWLQESPEPVSYVSWGSWLEVHPDTAAAAGIRDGEMVKVSIGGREAPVAARLTADVVPGVAALPFGYGHAGLGANARGLGANAFHLIGLDAKAPGPATLVGTGASDPPVTTSPTRDQFSRRILRWTSPALAQARPIKRQEEIVLPLPEGYSRERDLYPPHYYPAHRWAMAIDLHRCTGCGACGVACYAENNVPVMGRDQVGRGREMAWLKVVPYNHPDEPRRIGWMPMLCQHCDSAPCEPVCPVFASVHTQEGLNAQIFNRCVGTRYCANNCPYKVRRFNWFDPRFQKPLTWQLNPEVTVRVRGVMEKCTFCVQRIRQAEYQARLENRALTDGEIAPACAQSCPARVFTFGDLMDPKSRVSEIFRRDPRGYQALPELNTKPAVIYLKRIDGGRERG